MSSTIVEKILARKSGKKSCRAGEYVWVEPDLAISHDLNYTKYRRMLNEIGYPDIRHPDKFFVTVDHTTHSESQDKLADHRYMREDTRQQRVGWFLDIGRQGISHNAPLDFDLVKPGMLVLASDTRAPALGSHGALSIAIGMGLATVMALGKTWLRVPETLKVEITGQRRSGVMSRDIAQWVACRIGSEKADYRCIEFDGPIVRQFDMDERHTLCNAMVDIGVKAAICVPSIADQLDIQADSDACYVEQMALDISTLEAQVCCPPNLENIAPLSKVKGQPINSAFIGSCIGGKMEDMRAASAVLKGRKVHPNVRMTIIPATQKIYQQCLHEGLLQQFSDCGADIAVGICGPCYGVYAPLGESDVAICTATRNDHGRMGHEKSRSYIANAAVVAASAIAGQIVSPEDLEPQQ